MINQTTNNPEVYDRENLRILQNLNVQVNLIKID